MRTLWILVWKDLLIDFRKKEHLVSMVLFSMLTALVFQFSLGESSKIFQGLVPGMAWAIFLMSGVLGLGKSFSQEMENRCWEGLLLSPASRGTLFFGKVLSITAFLVSLQCLVIPMYLIFFNLEIPSSLGSLLGVITLGTLGFSPLGCLLAAMTTSIKGKEILLPILLFPLLVPCLLSVVKITAYLFSGVPEVGVTPWWQMLIGFDVIFLTMSWLCFDFILQE